MIAAALLALLLPSQPDPIPQRTADQLLALVPPSTPLVIVLDQLQTYRDAQTNSALTSLPPIRRWLQSDDHARLVQSLSQLEAVLGLTLSDFQHDILGDCVVLALDISDPGGEPRGLLLLKPPKPERLRRALDSLNAVERASGSLLRLEEQGGQAGPWITRRFRGDRPADFYAYLPDHAFAWSNSPSLLQDVLARSQLPSPPIAPWMDWLRRRLPTPALLSAYLNISRLTALSDRLGSDFQRLLPLLSRFQSAGCAFTFGSRVELHAVERLTRPQDWTAPDTQAGPRLAARLPDRPIALAAGSLDLPQLSNQLLHLVTERDPDARPLLETALAGLLGTDNLDRDVLSHLGPGALLAWLPDASSPEPRPSPVPVLLLLVEFADSPLLRSRIETATRTVMALAALDPQQRAAGSRLQILEHDGHTLLVYRQTGLTLAVHVGPGLFAASTDPARLLALLKSDPGAVPGRPAWLVPDRADQFLQIQGDALHRWIDAHRRSLADRLSRDRQISSDQAARQLDDLLDSLAGLDTLTLTNQLDPADGSLRQWLRLEPTAP
ncbi:MAG: hypothetical protein KatS3mg108_3293 [Isosphaeraceae bacterium]|nr:MAG: hypothetical protein KatS3mg108_3293 [Isosphaeraceae bacterium]